jgi:hypothetical protein
MGPGMPREGWPPGMPPQHYRGGPRPPHPGAMEGVSSVLSFGYLWLERERRQSYREPKQPCSHSMGVPCLLVVVVKAVVG